MYTTKKLTWLAGKKQQPFEDVSSCWKIREVFQLAILVNSPGGWVFKGATKNGTFDFLQRKFSRARKLDCLDSGIYVPCAYPTLQEGRCDLLPARHQK